MKKILLLPLFLLISFTSFSAPQKKELLERYCEQLGGKVVNKFKCPKSKLTIPLYFCVYKTAEKKRMFFDGCTGPSGGHMSLFFPQCIKHDYCYHHEPISNGRTQKECDEEMRDGMLDLCEKAKDPKKCRRWALNMYVAVRSFGKIAYECANYEADYTL